MKDHSELLLTQLHSNCGIKTYICPNSFLFLLFPSPLLPFLPLSSCGRKRNHHAGDEKPTLSSLHTQGNFLPVLIINVFEGVLI